MTLQKPAKIIGIIFIIIGVIGFIPFLVINGNLIGIFAVDPIHNIVHLIIGIIGLIAATKVNYAKLYFQVFGVIFAIITLVGFFSAGNIFMMRINMADNFLLLAITIVFLYFGFFFKPGLTGGIQQ